MGYTKITISVDEQALKRIDEGAKRDGRSRSNFMQFASDERAKEVCSNE